MQVDIIELSIKHKVIKDITKEDKKALKPAIQAMISTYLDMEVVKSFIFTSALVGVYTDKELRKRFEDDALELYGEMFMMCDEAIKKGADKIIPQQKIDRLKDQIADAGGLHDLNSLQ